jgi:hypothetical protein
MRFVLVVRCLRPGRRVDNMVRLFTVVHLFKAMIGYKAEFVNPSGPRAGRAECAPRRVLHVRLAGCQLCPPGFGTGGPCPRIQNTSGDRGSDIAGDQRR